MKDVLTLKFIVKELSDYQAIHGGQAQSYVVSHNQGVNKDSQNQYLQPQQHLINNSDNAYPTDQSTV